MASVSIVRRLGDRRPVRHQDDLQRLGIRLYRQERQKDGKGNSDSLNPANKAAAISHRFMLFKAFAITLIGLILVHPVFAQSESEEPADDAIFGALAKNYSHELGLVVS